MNSKITILKLAQLLSIKSGKKPEECENLVRSLFRVISSALRQGDNVKVKGLGTFKLSQVEARKSVDVNSGEENEIPAHRRITFIPAKEMAAAINAPFEMFETVVLEEGITEQQLEAAAEGENNLEVEMLSQQLILEHEQKDEIAAQHPAVNLEASEVVSDDPTTEEDDDTNASEELSVTTEKNNLDSQNGSSSNDSNELPSSVSAVDSSLSEADEDVVKPVRRYRWGWYIAIGAVIILLCLTGLWWFYRDILPIGNFTSQQIPMDTATIDTTVVSAVTTLSDSINDSVASVDNAGDNKENSVNDAEKDESDESELIDPVPTKASDEPVYDYVSDTRYLSMIAREHYGNYHLWPYIYKENEKILGHPNRIRPGTKVVVPPLSKYGIDPNNKEDIEKAKRLGVEIYKRFDR